MTISYMNEYFFGTKIDDFNYLDDISIPCCLNENSSLFANSDLFTLKIYTKSHKDEFFTALRNLKINVIVCPAFVQMNFVFFSLFIYFLYVFFFSLFIFLFTLLALSFLFLYINRYILHLHCSKIYKYDKNFC